MRNIGKSPGAMKAASTACVAAEAMSALPVCPRLVRVITAKQTVKATVDIPECAGLVPRRW